MKSAKELGITRTQRKNLAKLAVRFRDLKRNGYKGKFNMKIYCGEKGATVENQEGPQESVKVFHECGSSGCLLGHSPYLGIGLSCISQLKSKDLYDQWEIFSKLTFGIAPDNCRWKWLFHEDWSSGKEHALKRISWVLEKGFPEYYEFDCYNRRATKGFRAFSPNWEEIEKAAK